MNQEGAHYSSTLIARFGSWNNAVRKIGCEPNQHDSISRTELIAEVERVAEKLGDSPTKAEFQQHTKYSLGTYNNRFEGWDQVLEKAGLTPNRRDTVTREELRGEIRRLHRETGETPTIDTLKQMGQYSVYSYYNKFDSWKAALEECGFTTETGGVEYTDDELLEELRRLAEELGRTPTAEQMGNHGKYSPTAYKQHFDTWNNAVQKAELEPNVRIDIPKEELLTELNSSW